MVSKNSNHPILNIIGLFKIKSYHYCPAALQTYPKRFDVHGSLRLQMSCPPQPEVADAASPESPPEAASDTSPPGPPPPKPVPKGTGKSYVWKYMTAPYEAKTGKWAGKLVTTCVVPVAREPGYCGATLSYQYNTTTMMHHLQGMHSKEMAQVN